MCSEMATVGTNSGVICEDVFETLKRYDLHLSPHVELILKKLGFKCLRSISLISNLEEIETDVKTILATKVRLDKMSDEEKVALFGEHYADPKDFIFMRGERLQLIGAVNMAKQLLSKYEENYNYERPILSRKRAAVNEGIELNTAHQRTSSPSFYVPKKRKTIAEYVERWMSATKFPLIYSINNCEIDNESRIIKCKLCPRVKSFNVTLDPYGSWKISSFVSHLKAAHVGKENPKSSTTNSQHSSTNGTQDVLASTTHKLL